jgi:hypothetical protein
MDLCYHVGLASHISSQAWRIFIGGLQCTNTRHLHAHALLLGIALQKIPSVATRSAVYLMLYLPLSTYARTTIAGTYNGA